MVRVLRSFSEEVHPAGFEPTTPWSEAKCSIQLSYGCPFCQKEKRSPYPFARLYHYYIFFSSTCKNLSVF